MSNEPRAGAVIYAADAARLSAFYARLNGFAVVHADDEDVLRRSSTFELVILVTAESRAAGNSRAPSTSPTPRTQAAIKPMFYVPDLAAARLVARELGGALKSVDDEWRFRDSIVCDGYDPEGSIFQLRQRDESVRDSH